MKKHFFFFLMSIFILSCNKKSEVEKKIAATKMDLKTIRYDKAFFETPVKDIALLKKQFPAFFPANTPDSVWTNKMTHPLWRELYQEVQKKFGNFEKQEADIENLWKHINYYYPATKKPKIITLIYEMDADYKAIYADSIVLISLEMYLGKDHKFYEYPVYQKKTFEPSQILPDIVESLSWRKIPPSKKKDLLSMMLLAGKQLYLKDVLLPDYSDADKIGYTPKEIEWCLKNESDMWRFFIDQKLLYDNDSKLEQRFISPAPFSKFGLVSDNETPGRVGAWIGWQIVRSYMNNNKVDLQEMLEMTPEQIFKDSKYKPKKND